MVSELAKGDYEDLRAEGLNPTLEDFVRLNNLALRLTDGAETTVANFPRIGWAGDVPFYEPTYAAFLWYLGYVERDGKFDVFTKDNCWFYALAHGRTAGAFDGLHAPDKIKATANDWVLSLPVTRKEITRACRYAVDGLDDAEPGKTDAQREAAAAKTESEKRESSLATIDEEVSVAAAVTGIPPTDLAVETRSRLKRMIEAVRDANPMGGGDHGAEKNRLTADYQLAFREIKLRLLKERDAATSVTASSSCREGLQPEAKEVNNGVL